MRGQVDHQLPLFHIFEVEDRIRPDHSLRDIKRRTDRFEGNQASSTDRTHRGDSGPPQSDRKSRCSPGNHDFFSTLLRMLCRRGGRLCTGGDVAGDGMRFVASQIIPHQNRKQNRQPEYTGTGVHADQRAFVL